LKEVEGNKFYISRDIFENDIWQKPTELRLFLYLVGKAMFTDGVKIGGIELKRGQFIRSYRNIVKDLAYIENNAVKEYSLSTISKLIDKLINEDRITKEDTELGTLFTITNYSQYQALPQTNNATKNGERTEKEQRPNNNKNVKNVKEKDTTTENINEVVNLYKEKLQLLPQPSKITDARKKAINARIKDYSLEEVKEVIDLISQSDYLLGRINDFKATIDWIFNPSNFAKIKEGNYKNRGNNSKVAGVLPYEDNLGKRVGEVWKP